MTRVSTRGRRLRGKSVVLIGAVRGIGLATAQVMSAEGARLVLADIDEEGINNVAARIRSAGGEAVAVKADISREEDVQNLVKIAVEHNGTIDVLHQNAAILEPAHLTQDINVLNTPESVWAKTFDVNFFGTLSCCRNVIPVMKANGGGSIVLTGSMAGAAGYPALTAYSASKAALVKLAIDIATAFGRDGIRCNVVAPGQILTELGRQVQGEEGIKAMTRVMATPYAGEPKDIAYGALFLASDESKFVTGHVLPVDGGAFMHAPDVEFDRTAASEGQRAATQAHAS